MRMLGATLRQSTQAARVLTLTATLVLCLATRGAAAPIDDCSTCNGTLSSPPDTVTDPISGSTIDLVVTQVSNGECDSHCVEDLGCQFHFTQVIQLGGVGGTISATEGSVYKGRLTTSVATSPQLPSGLAANDSLRKGARCGEVLTYVVTVSPISGTQITASATYQCSDCTAPAQ